MQSKLEDVLKDKERELKLHQSFLNLKNYCEENIFPLVDIPLKQHVETLKQLIESIIPDPKDRTQEMFSGEVFALLGTIYLHDIGLIKDFKWSFNGDILNSIEIAQKQLFLNAEIGKTVDIPESAIEIINYLSFSNIVKKIPIEWEITEGSRKAIIRNTKVIQHVFNFSHLLLDIFCSDLQYFSLRRFKNLKLVLMSNNADINIDSREGVIHIKYDAKFPYELHVLDSAQHYVEDMFNIFKNDVNGRLGFQYREIVWDITKDFDYHRDIFEMPKLSPYNEFEKPPFNRMEEASILLDRLFNFGYVMAVGEAGTGKTTVLKSFIIPQIFSITPNVFYCELWGSPVNEIRDVICKKYARFSYSDLDIISMCMRLLDEGPCFFVIDACEKLVNMNEREKEKFERFIDFCLDRENIYLIVSGDKEIFFEWYMPFHRMNMSAIYEIKPIEGTKAIDTYGEDRVFWDTSEYYKPVEFELLQANLNLEKVLEDILKSVKDKAGLREVLASIVEKNEKYLKRYTLENIFFETCIPPHDIFESLNLLKEKDIVKETEFVSITYYALSSRYLKEPLYKVLKLDEFEEKKKIRNLLQNAIINETFLDSHTLEMVEKWKERMVFSKEDMGWILGSLILQSKDYEHFFEKAKRDGKGIDIQPLLKLLYIDNAEKRGRAVKLLIEIQDKNMINPLLLHLRRENVLEIKNLLIQGIGLTGKKRAIVAIMNTLEEIGDKKLRLKAIEFFYSLFGENARQLLTDIREKEKDPIVLMKIDSLLSKPEESS